MRSYRRVVPWCADAEARCAVNGGSGVGSSFVHGVAQEGKRPYGDGGDEREQEGVLDEGGALVPAG